MDDFVLRYIHADMSTLNGTAYVDIKGRRLRGETRGYSRSDSRPRDGCVYIGTVQVCIYSVCGQLGCSVTE